LMTGIRDIGHDLQRGSCRATGNANASDPCPPIPDP
jgi:hypothetical protein